MQIENKIKGDICLLNALYVSTFVQCLHSAVWMAGTKNSFVGTPEKEQFSMLKRLRIFQGFPDIQNCILKEDAWARKVYWK